MVGKNYWYVEITPCYPNSFKVVNKAYRPNNAGCNYFPTFDEAQEEANKRNANNCNNE